MVAIIKTQTIFSTSPTLTISLCLTCPVPKTIAFGGVATGNINAQDAPRPMINARPNGATFKACAIEIKIGTNNAALAVFEVNSVRKIIKMETIKPIS